MSDLIWLRAETKAMEARSGLTPDLVRELLNSGKEVVVERSSQRAIDDSSFAGTGCTMVDEGTWSTAPKHAYILGLKELPENNTPLIHRHIYFAHAYKNQHGCQELLRRFKEGGGELFDLEYLVDETDRRVAAFGFWAGFAGCAVSLKIWAGQQLGNDPVISTLAPYSDKDALIEDIRAEVTAAIDVAKCSPSLIVIGALGRVGQGAVQLAQELGLSVTQWDMKETLPGGPFAEILEHDIYINCVLVQKKIPPFVTADSLVHEDRSLSVICDVSCDPGEYNPIPLYSEATTFSAPIHKVIEGDNPLYLSAIDHLPSLLPVEASEDFGQQLLPHLLSLNGKRSDVWQRALTLFHEKSNFL
jgi:saccharopine dehydrogenase (NAD+, L-lysine-forming)